MSWVLVAKKDFQDAVRSKMVWGLILLYVLFVTGLGFYVLSNVPKGIAPKTVNLAIYMGSQSTIFVPAVSLAAAYNSVVGERESGSLKLLLGLPHTRWEVMVGKFIGRSLVVGLAIIVGYTAGILTPLALGYSILPSAIIVLILVTFLLGITFVGIAIAFSTAMRSSRKALYGAVGIIVLFSWVWERIPRWVVTVSNGFETPDRLSQQLPEWIILYDTANPQNAYIFVLAHLSPGPGGGYAIPSGPFFRDWFGVASLLLWIVVPLGLAYYRFHTMDLGGFSN
jgi:ABC-2 type transport system permease protein